MADGSREFDGRETRGDARAQLSSADREVPLELEEPEELVRLAMAAYLVGADTESGEIWERAHHEFLRRGEAPRAARCAFWLAFQLWAQREPARASGWISRARRLIDEGQHDCVEQGYLLFPIAMQHIFAGDIAAAYAAFGQSARIGERFRDRDLVTLARHGEARALIMLGKTAEGMALLDEIMIAVTANEVSAIVVGDVYCGVIEACHEVFDLRRAQEWTAAMSRWCASQPNLIHYRGQCLVRRAELMQLQGEWPDALEEAQRACEWLSRPPPKPAVGAAFYRRAELHRLRGAFQQAEEDYREASNWGRSPRPGLALLRLAQGQVDAAEAAIRRLMDEARAQRTGSTVLPAYVEIMLAAKDVVAARAAADELSEVAASLDAPFLRAASGHATGAVLLAEREPRAALMALRRACAAWQEVEAPYEVARTRVLIGLVCRDLGDDDAARMELDAAKSAFQRLCAVPDLARIEALCRKTGTRVTGRLTAREEEVLRLVAAGNTNRAIAASLAISEKTVARHMSNIFTKLGLASRSAATAYAYERGLV